MYFLGSAGVIRFGSLRIGGISGVKKPSAYTRPIETPPFNPKSMETAYGMRKDDVNLLQQITEPIDIMMSHDWPAGMEEYGDAAQLFARKAWMQTADYGNEHTRGLLDQLRPRYWLSSHMHVHFSAQVQNTEFLALDKVLPGKYCCE